MSSEGRNPTVSCQCGAVAFPASAPEPIAIYICHCLECRKQSASAFGCSYVFPAAGMWPPSSQSVLDSLSVWTRKADSGNTIECWFCKHCGVRLLHRPKLPSGEYKGTVTVKGGCVEGFGRLERARHIFVRSALVDVPEGSDQAEPSPR